MTRSVTRRGASVAGQELLVGLDGRGRLLDVEVERHVGMVLEHVEDLVERGHREVVVAGRPAAVGVGIGCEARGLVPPGNEPVGVVESPQLRQGHGVDRPVSVRGPVDRAVVAHHQVTVGGGVDVELDPGDTELERTPQGEQRR